MSETRHGSCSWLLLFSFETGSHLAWAGLGFTMQPRITLNLWSACLYPTLPSFKWCWERNLGLLVCSASLPHLSLFSALVLTHFHVSKTYILNLGMVTHAFNPHTCGVVQEDCHEFKCNQGPCLRKTNKKHIHNQAWWYTLFILALGKLWQKETVFNNSLGHKLMRPCFKIPR